MADVQAIIDAAVARSAAAQPHLLTEDAPELLRVVQRALSRLYLLAARRRSTNFGQMATVTYTAGAPGGWPFPSDALSVLRVETAAGAEVAVTRIDDKTGMQPMPSVYELGRVLVTCGAATDPTVADVLTVVYAASAPQLATTATPLPAAFPEMFHPLLELPLAQYIARKDARAEDLAQFQSEESEWTAYFDAWLTDASIAPGDRFAGFRPAQVSAASDDGG